MFELNASSPMSEDYGVLMEHRGYDLHHLPDPDGHELSFAHPI
jgi:hypothetical protein